MKKIISTLLAMLMLLSGVVFAEPADNTVYVSISDDIGALVLAYVPVTLTDTDGDGALTIHGRVRPLGSQNEAVFHCNWGSDPKYFYGGSRGGLNDWLVAWPCAFRLAVLATEESF
jgi:hypothetical protein